MLALPDGTSPTDPHFLGITSNKKAEAESRRQKQHGYKQKVQCQWGKGRQSEYQKETKALL